MERVNFRIIVDAGPDADDKTRNDAVVALRSILVAKRVGTVDRDRRESDPDGGKSGGLLEIAALLAVVAPPMFATLRAGIAAWERQRTGRSAKVVLGEHSLELHGITQKQAKAIAEAYWKQTDPTPEVGDGNP